MSTTAPSISDWLKSARKKADMSPAELAAKIGAKTNDLRAWENGDAMPTLADIQKLKTLLGAPSASTSTKNTKPYTDDDTGRDIDFENKLFKAADKLRNNMDAAEYKHVVLGLIFLKYISDAFDERHEQLQSEPYADPEDRDEYIAQNVFWVPKDARWSYLQENAKQPTIGKLIDDAMVAIERDNPTLKGVLPKQYNRPALDKHTLGELIDLIGSIGLGGRRNRSRDILGRVYEYFLSQFASAEGKRGGQFYTPRSVVQTLVEMIAPYRGRVYDPCCGSGGMFVQSEQFIEQHGGRRDDIAVYGQESNPTTWRLAKMNLAIRGIDADLGGKHADSFHEDLHKDLKADYIITNPPFNASDWGGDRLQDDARWKYGMPPNSNANYAWIQHFLHHLAPTGYAGFVMANGSMSTQQSGEGEIRKSLVDADLVDCIVALPGQLFFSTQIPVCLWFLARDKSGKGHKQYRNRRGETLFIDARKMGEMISRTQRELTAEDIQKIATTYHAWRGDFAQTSNNSSPLVGRSGGASSPIYGGGLEGAYEDIKGFCKSTTRDEIAEHHYVLTPGRYVGIEDINTDDDEPFEEKMERLTDLLAQQFAESHKLEAQIRQNLKELGYEL